MKIVVVEDHIMFREVICKVCTRSEEHEVVGATALGARAVDLVGQHRPDLLILDLSLPDMDGFEVVRLARPLAPAMRVFVVSTYLDAYTSYRVEEAGCQGFADKATTTTDMLQSAMEAMAAGKTWFSPAFEEVRRVRRANPWSFDKVLSAAEMRVLSLVALGLTDAAIGARLGTTEWTAQAHRSHILKKLRLDGTPQLIAYANHHGFARFGLAQGMPLVRG